MIPLEIADELKRNLERIELLGTEKENLRLQLEGLRGVADQGRVESREPEDDIRKIGDKFNDAAKQFADDFEELREFLDEKREDLNEADATISATIRDVGKTLESTGRETREAVAEIVEADQGEESDDGYPLWWLGLAALAGAGGLKVLGKKT